VNRDEYMKYLFSRGYSVPGVAGAVRLSERQVYRILENTPDLKAEAERIDPQAWRVLRDAMNARKDDGCDWPSRIAAAKAALTIPTEADGRSGTETQTLIIHRDGDVELVDGELTEEEYAEHVIDPVLAAESS
jgi:hypothetical protein